MIDYDGLNRFLFPGCRNQISLGDDLYSQFEGRNKIKSVPVINKDNVRQGLHIDQVAIFNDASLLVALYVRNTFKENTNTPNGIKLCIKLIASPKAEMGYLPLSESNSARIAMELDADKCAQLYNIINAPYVSSSTASILTNSKSISVELLDQSSRFPLIFTVNEGELCHRINIDHYQRYRINLLIVSMYKIFNPELCISDINCLILSGVNKSIINNTESIDPPLCDDRCAFDVDDPLGELDPLRLTEGQSKALYAIGIQRWPKKDKEVIAYIQQRVSQRVADVIIKEGNNGNYSLFEYVYSLINLTEGDNGIPA